MFIDRQKGRFLREKMKHTGPEFFGCMQDRNAGVPAVFLRVVGKSIKSFSFLIGTFRIKNAMGRKACEIFLAGLQMV